MTCQEFQDHLHEYVDESLASKVQAAARNHAGRCPECRRALQRLQSFGHAMEHAFDEATEPISIQPALTQNILRAARAQQLDRPAGLRAAWHWFTANPFRMAGAAAMLAGLLLVGLQFHRSASVAGSPHISYSIDVPYQTVTHVFEVHNGTVIDSMVTRVVAVDVHFSSYSSSARP
jgi:anti-sigma factor RsiW